MPREFPNLKGRYAPGLSRPRYPSPSAYLLEKLKPQALYMDGNLVSWQSLSPTRGTGRDSAKHTSRHFG